MASVPPTIRSCCFARRPTRSRSASACPISETASVQYLSRLRVPLTFLPKGRHYDAQIYRDGPGADYRTAPTKLTIESRTVTSKDSLDIEMAPAGGMAVRFRYAP